MLSVLLSREPKEPIIVERTPCTIPVNRSVFRTSSAAAPIGPIGSDCGSVLGGVGVGPDG